MSELRKSAEENESRNHTVAENLAKWIKANDKLRPRGWSSVGKEIYSRKTLLIAAASDLNKEEETFNLGDPWKLAATDVFVEKAQKKLTFRAFAFMTGGIITALLAIYCLIFAIQKAYETDITRYFGKLITESEDLRDINAFAASLVVLKISAIAGLVAWLVHFLISLSRAMFDEGTVLFHRRHALRFGRLYVYLRKGDIKFSELEDAFGWHNEFTSSFRHMKVRGDSFERNMIDLAKTAIESSNKKMNDKYSSKIKKED